VSKETNNVKKETYCLTKETCSVALEERGLLCGQEALAKFAA
jgi:hypothetical protein